MLGLTIRALQPKKSLDLAQLQIRPRQHGPLVADLCPSSFRPVRIVTSENGARLASPSSRRAAAL